MARYQTYGVGTHIARKLRDMGIRYEDASGCNCYKTMTDMNQAGPDRILANLDMWEKRVQESARNWFKEVYADKKWIRRFIGEKAAQLGIRPMIKWGCEQAKKDLEWLQHQQTRT